MRVLASLVASWLTRSGGAGGFAGGKVKSTWVRTVAHMQAFGKNLVSSRRVSQNNPLSYRNNVQANRSFL